MPDTVAAPIVPQATGVPAADQPLLDAQLPGMTPPAPGQVAAGPPVPANMILPPADAVAAMAPPPAVVPPAAPALPTDPQAIGKEAIADARDASVDEQKAAKEQADAQQAANDAKAKAAEDAAVQLREQQAEQDEQQQASDQARAHLVELAQKADDEVRDYKFTDWKSTVPTANRIGLALGAMLAGLGGSSDPLAQINKLTAQHFDQQKAELASKEAVAGYRRQGVTDLDKHVNDQRMALEFKERNFREAMAKEAEAQGLRSGNPVVAANAKQVAAKIRTDGDAKLMTMVDQYTQGEERRARAAALDRKGKGGGAGGGAGATAAYTAFTDAAQQVKPGEQIPASVFALGMKAGIKKDKIPSQVETLRNSGAKSGLEQNKADLATGATYDPKATVYVDGKPAFVAASARNVDKIGERLTKYHAAIRALDNLMNEKEIDQFSAPYKRAALGVASITNAPSSDKSTELEEGTLKNYGFLSREAIKQTRDEAAERLREMEGHLRPIPVKGGAAGGSVPPGAVVGKMNGKRGYVLDGKFTEL